MNSFDNLKHLNIHGADVYLAHFDGAVEVKSVLPLIRQRAIEECSDGQTKRQRYCVWQLLDYALKQTIGKGVDELDFAVDEYGKWSCNGGVHFSLSHSGSVVAVAVSASAVGIDVEAVDEQRFNARLASRILTEGELTLYSSVPQEQRPQMLAAAWTKKESVFKRDGGKSFVPSSIDTSLATTFSEKVTFGDNEFVLSVAV